MAAKQVLFDNDVREKLKTGVDTVANAVKVTIGPRGRNVALEKSFGGPTITNDGVSIAKEVSLADKFENMGAEVIKEVATKTNDAAGDGTSTAVVLTQAIVAEGYRRTALGANPMMVRRGIEDAARDVVEELRTMATQIKDKDEIKQVASISAESEEIGGIIAETIDKVGKDGVVTVEESQSFGIDSEVVEGLEFDKGYVSPYMVTNNERMEAEFKDASILVTDKKISNIKEILPLLEKIAAGGNKDLVIIADDIEGDALATFVVNKLRGAFNVLGIKAPGYGDRKKEMLGDIATTIGATVVTDDLGIKLENVELSMLGSAGRVVSTKDKTVVVDGKGTKKDIEARANQLKLQLDNTESKYDREKLTERIAKLAGGVAVIRVGAATETEMKYLKLKIEDAVNATKAAIEEGIVAGGGTALAQISKKLAEKRPAGKSVATHDVEYEAGYTVLVNSLSAPLRQIAYNAGHTEDAAVVVARVAEAKGNEGFDAVTGDYVDMLQKGIIDPVKVERSGVQNAASAAAILLTTEAAVAEVSEDEKAAPAPDMGGMGGMGGMY
ncbi:chaperonin GroEL [Patescibacteria group bacterium]|jgi:chaperonin GroEL|nr:chaperonin GroEL [Patescibacteria group bacterium]